MGNNYLELFDDPMVADLPYDVFIKRLQDEMNRKKETNKTVPKVATIQQAKTIKTQPVRRYRRTTSHEVTSLKKTAERSKQTDSPAQTEKKVLQIRTETKRKRVVDSTPKTIRKRFTEPKKRSLLSRIRLQQKLNRHYFNDIKDDLEEGYITKRDIEISKNAEKRKERKLYKKVQDYEDAIEDVTMQKGWRNFKIGLATTALAGVLALSSFTYNEVKAALDTPSSQIVSIYEMPEEERTELEKRMDEVRNEIIASDGYHFDNLTEEQFADAYIKIMNYETKMIDAILERIVQDDQGLLDRIVERSFEETNQIITDTQRRDYKQMAFELFKYSKPKICPDGAKMIRNPIVIDELAARDSAKSKGYSIKLRVNGDEVQTVKNLGNILHIINQMQTVDYVSFVEMENGQQLFFENVMKKAMGEEYEVLKADEIRDYQQIIYEWLPAIGKQYIKDPIDIEKQATIESNDLGIGD